MATDESAADLLAALDSGLMAGLVLAVEHFALWRYKQQMDSLHRPVAYIIGTATLLAGFWRWALVRHHTGAATALTLLIAVAGAFDLACYAWRGHTERADAATYSTDHIWLKKGWKAVGKPIHNDPARS